MKRLFLILTSLLYVYSFAYGGNNLDVSSTQYPKLSLREVNKRFVSDWNVNGVDAVVFLETGFMKVILMENFVEHNNSKLNLTLIKQPSNRASYNNMFYGGKLNIPYTIQDTLILNGKRQYLDALIGYTPQAQPFYDIVYPPNLISDVQEFNFKDGYLQELDSLPVLGNDFLSSKFIYWHRRPVVELELVCISGKDTASISGYFIIDSGSANGIVLNKEHSGVGEFISNLQSSVLDQSKIKDDKGLANVTALSPHKIKIGVVEIDLPYISAISMHLKEKDRNAIVGILGCPIFKNFHVFADWKNQIIYYKPTSDKVSIKAN